MSLKIENSRRVAKSRPVCMDLHSKKISHDSKILRISRRRKKALIIAPRI